MQNEIEDAISKVIKSEKWSVSNETRDLNAIQKEITLTNGKIVKVIIDIKNERILIKNTFKITPDFGNHVIGSLKTNLKEEFKMFLMPMDIYIQTDIIDPDLDTVHMIYCLYFDEFSKNKFYHAIYKIGDIPDLLSLMEKEFIDYHESPPSPS